MCLLCVVWCDLQPELEPEPTLEPTLELLGLTLLEMAPQLQQQPVLELQTRLGRQLELDVELSRHFHRSRSCESVTFTCSSWRGIRDCC